MPHHGPADLPGLHVFLSGLDRGFYDPTMAYDPTHSQKGRCWTKKIFAAGFLFFLVKGLLWLSVPSVYWIANGCLGSD